MAEAIAEDPDLLGPLTKAERAEAAQLSAEIRQWAGLPTLAEKEDNPERRKSTAREIAKVVSIDKPKER